MREKELASDLPEPKRRNLTSIYTRRTIFLPIFVWFLSEINEYEHQ